MSIQDEKNTQDDDKVQYLVIENWGAHLHPDQRKKVKPPYRWIKLQTEALDVQGDMTLREYGAYCRLLMLAGLTDNVVVYRKSWIKRRTGITPKDIEKLQKRGLVSIKNQTPKSEKDQQNQENKSEIASDSSDDSPKDSVPEGKGKGLDGTGLDLKGGDKTESPPGIRTTGPQPDFEQMTQACIEAGVLGSDWGSIINVIKQEFDFVPTEKQLNTIQRQLNDRARK